MSNYFSGDILESPFVFLMNFSLNKWLPSVKRNIHNSDICSTELLRLYRVILHEKFMYCTKNSSGPANMISHTPLFICERNNFLYLSISLNNISNNFSRCWKFCIKPKKEKSSIFDIISKETSGAPNVHLIIEMQM